MHHVRDVTLLRVAHLFSPVLLTGTQDRQLHFTTSSSPRAHFATHARGSHMGLGSGHISHVHTGFTTSHSCPLWVLCSLTIPFCVYDFSLPSVHASAPAAAFCLFLPDRTVLHVFVGQDLPFSFVLHCVAVRCLARTTYSADSGFVLGTPGPSLPRHFTHFPHVAHLPQLGSSPHAPATAFASFTFAARWTGLPCSGYLSLCISPSHRSFGFHFTRFYSFTFYVQFTSPRSFSLRWFTRFAFGRGPLPRELHLPLWFYISFHISICTHLGTIFILTRSTIGFLGSLPPHGPCAHALHHFCHLPLYVLHLVSYTSCHSFSFG